mgnify:CR=1 FL=1
MSTRVRYSIVKGVPADDVRALIDDAITQFPGPRPRSSRWSDFQPAVQPSEKIALMCGETLVLADDAWKLARAIANRLETPYLELRVQEGDHWDFTLMHADEIIADFSTRVSYFNDDESAPRPWKRGSGEAFCSRWGVSLERVDPCLVDWDALEEPRKTGPADAYATGGWEQIIDFMRVLGVENPYGHPDSFPVVVPMWESTYLRQPLWRRAIRRLSVKIKGTYPDVPRRPQGNSPSSAR